MVRILMHQTLNQQPISQHEKMCLSHWTRLLELSSKSAPVAAEMACLMYKLTAGWSSGSNASDAAALEAADEHSQSLTAGLTTGRAPVDLVQCLPLLPVV